MKKSPINLGELETALEDQNELELHSYWLDTETGEVIFLTDDLDEQDELREQIEENAAGRFVSIEPIDSHEGFRVMTDFVDALPPTRLREKLERALNSPKPFRRFKDALYENKAIQEKWYEFHDKAVERFALEWLADLGIEVSSGAFTAIDTDVQSTSSPVTLSPHKSPPPVTSEAESLSSSGAETQGRACKAGLEFVARELRLHHPDGKFDDGERFYPSEKEWRDCCAGIRAPSRAFPFSLMKHCRTAKHVAKLYGVTEKDLKIEATEVRKELWYLCLVRDFDQIRSILQGPTLTIDPFLTSPAGQSPRAILTKTRTHGILKRQVWDQLFAALDDYENRWKAAQ